MDILLHAPSDFAAVAVAISGFSAVNIIIRYDLWQPVVRAL